MTEYKRTLITGVTAEAQVVSALVGIQLTVRIVAVTAVHFSLFNRVMRWEVGFSHHLHVAGEAKLRIFFFQVGFEGFFSVHGVAVSTAEVSKGMLAVSPVHQLAVGVAF